MVDNNGSWKEVWTEVGLPFFSTCAIVYAVAFGAALLASFL
jgi:hypothetical protein